MSRSLSISQIHAQVLTIPEKYRKNCAVGICSVVPWLGEQVIKAGGTKYFVHQCDSPLALREAIRKPPSDGICVVVTDLKDSDLDLDILLRLAKGQLYSIDRWSIVKGLFQATSIDPRIANQQWIADLLIEISNETPFPPAPTGFLDAELVWPILLSSTIGMSAANSDLESILKWSTRKLDVARWRSMPDEFRKGTTDWLSKSAGEAARCIMRTVDAGEEPDALPLGLVLDVLCNRDQVDKLAVQRVRLEERYLGGEPLSIEIAQRWAAVAKGVVQLGFMEPTLEKWILSRAEAILNNIDAASVAYLSDVLPFGLSQRLAQVGTTMLNQIEQSTFGLTDALQAQFQSVKRHHKLKNEQQRLSRLEMALRVMRWLESETANPRRFTSLEDAADFHLTDGGFIDWARLSLHYAEPIAPLAKAYAKLFGVALSKREQQAERFANLLVDWTKIGSSGRNIVGVEDICKDYLAPLALGTAGKPRPVLMIVLDGMSVGVFRELIHDVVRRQDWVWGVRSDIGHLSGALATIPSVTERSRASLFAGKISRGNSDFEVRAFAENQELLSACKHGKPPKVFHKASMNPGEDTELEITVRESIADTSFVVVATVVNAIDDHLAKGQQIDADWSRDGIKTLSLQLHEAKAAGRLVLIVSDHGHVLDTRSRYENFPGGGERWRLDNGPLNEFECRVTGSRVVGESSVIVPWTDSVRYSSSKKNGYHGGINPQEMVVPIALLSPDEQLPTGWVEAPMDEPSWWEEPFIAESPAPIVTRVTLPAPTPPGFLFNPHATPNDAVFTVSSSDVSSTGTPQWMEHLLRSPVFASQKQLVRRACPTDEEVKAVLSALEIRGGKATMATLARALSHPPTRLSGLLVQIGRLMNVDAYDVISRDHASDTITLNVGLLLKQFDIRMESGR